MPALAGDLPRPPRELAAEDAGVELLAARGEEIPFHVLHCRLDLALLLGAADGRRIDLEAVVPRALPVAAIEGRRARDTERGADHRGLQIVRHDDGGHAAERGERLGVAREPGLDALIEDDATEEVARVAEHEDKDPRLAEHAGGGIVEAADVAEVDLGELAGRRLDWDRDVVRLDATRPLEAETQPLAPPVSHGVTVSVQRATLETCCGGVFGGNAATTASRSVVSSGSAVTSPAKSPRVARARRYCRSVFGLMRRRRAIVRGPTPSRCKRTKSCKRCMSILSTGIPSSAPGRMTPWTGRRTRPPRRGPQLVMRDQSTAVRSAELAAVTSAELGTVRSAELAVVR